MKREKRQEYSGESDRDYRERSQQDPLMMIRQWMYEVQPLKLIKISQNIMTFMIQTWSKFRITLLKQINQQENRVLDYMARLRKQVQWLNKVKAGQKPQLDKLTSKLYKDCQKLIQEKVQFSQKDMLKQSKLANDKILDIVKTNFQTIKQTISLIIQKFRNFSSITEILNQKTYFKFLQKCHHSQIEILNQTAVTCHNQSYQIDFGVVVGPTLTKTNYRVAFRIQHNDKYQSYIGIGVCHPKIVKKNNYNKSGIGSGCYLIRQQTCPTNVQSLSHAYEQDGSEKRPKKVPWGFGEGDIILIEMDFSHGYVQFSKDKLTYKMKVDLDQGPVNPYVVLHSKWDGVSIINQ